MISDTTDALNLFDNERRTIFGKIYLANVRNRLRELINPNNVDCKRWIWELVQNAKDSISGQKDKTTVDIEIIVDGDTYLFKHNGSPFTMKTITALLYKFSEGKQNNGESTGRFGTGFLTTHSVSKTVTITGDIYLKEGQSELQSFTVTMYREGEDQELLKGLELTERSFKISNKPIGWTTYEYKASTKRNKEAGRLGIENFKSNIAKVMLFCQEINSIKLNDNGKLLTINRISDDSIGNECRKLVLDIVDNGQSIRKKFIYHKIEEYNEKLTERFSKERNLRICIAIELDCDNNIYIDPSSPCLFCSLPLVGSEHHEFPFIINSPDFEPDSERQAILLDGNEIDEKDGKISDPGINKMILIRAQEMYKVLLDCITNMDIKKRYLLTRGIRNTPYITRFFDSEWYEMNFINPMRDILIQYPIVPSFEESKLIENNIWNNDKRIRYIRIEDCVERVANCGKISILSKIVNDPWNWLDEFLLFIKDHYFRYLISYSLIPNMNSIFVQLTDDLATSKSVPENMIQCIESLNIIWKNNHIHKMLPNFSTGNDH
eukprot:jgi/Orpsp1_1/1192271/evm.model.d7180000091887.1